MSMIGALNVARRIAYLVVKRWRPVPTDRPSDFRPSTYQWISAPGARTTESGSATLVSDVLVVHRARPSASRTVSVYSTTDSDARHTNRTPAGVTTASLAGMTTASVVEFAAEGIGADRIRGLLAVGACREMTMSRTAAAAAPTTATEGQRRTAGAGAGAAFTSRLALTNSDRHWKQSAT